MIDANVIRSHRDNKADGSKDDTDQLIAKFNDVECLDLSCLSEYTRRPRANTRARKFSASSFPSVSKRPLDDVISVLFLFEHFSYTLSTKRIDSHGLVYVL